MVLSRKRIFRRCENEIRNESSFVMFFLKLILHVHVYFCFLLYMFFCCTFIHIPVILLCFFDTEYFLFLSGVGWSNDVWLVWPKQVLK